MNIDREPRDRPRLTDTTCSFNKSLADPLVEALTAEESSPKGLRALNTTLYTLTSEQLGKIVAVQKNVMVLQVTAEVEPGEEYKKSLLKALKPCKLLEQVEVVSDANGFSPRGQVIDLLLPYHSVRTPHWNSS